MAIRFIIVKRVPEDMDKPYEGMDRPPLGSFLDIPEPLILQGMALEDLPDPIAEASYKEFLIRIEATGTEGYELLALGDRPSSSWDFLGFDVGETTPTAWSAISHRDVIFSPQELNDWEERLNSHGLFDKRIDAENYLTYYLASDDPDKGWTEEGWVDEPDFYAVVPVYKYRAPNIER